MNTLYSAVCTDSDGEPSAIGKAGKGRGNDKEI